MLYSIDKYAINLCVYVVQLRLALQSSHSIITYLLLL